MIFDAFPDGSHMFHPASQEMRSPALFDYSRRVSDTLLCLGPGKLKSSLGVTEYFVPSGSSEQFIEQSDVSGFLAGLYFS